MSDNRKSEKERVEILKKGIKDGKACFGDFRWKR